MKLNTNKLIKLYRSAGKRPTLITPSPTLLNSIIGPMGYTLLGQVCEGTGYGGEVRNKEPVTTHRLEKGTYLGLGGRRVEFPLLLLLSVLLA